MNDDRQASDWLPAWCSPEEIDTVLVALPDVFGRLLGKSFTRDYFVHEVVSQGTHVCNYLLTVDVEMNPLEGFSVASWEQGYGDFHVDVETRTLRRIPWRPGAAIVLGDLEHANGDPVEEAPRAVLRRQLARLHQQGLSAFIGSELEFYLFHHSYEEATRRDYRDLKPSSDYLIDYHLLQPAGDENVLRRIRNEMTEAGVIVEGSKGEWGKGQHELNLVYAEAMEMADRHALYKHGAKEIATQEGRAITFMAKWDTQQAGSSFHLHSSLWDTGAKANQFWDPESEGPSEHFHHYLAGLLKYTRELAYFYAPTINSYKRYQAASWAPTNLVWARDNRTTALRVIGHGNSFRVENRSPGADANPYLAYAATVAAGLRGIEERLECPEAYRGNAYEDPSLPRLPDSLQEAAELLDQSEMARGAFGDAVIDFYVHTARQEVLAHQAAVSDWERQRYFERL